MKQRYIGTVKWFNAAKGYGFIGCDNVDDVFVHFSSIQRDSYHLMEKGRKVEFWLEESPRGLQATGVVPL